MHHLRAEVLTTPTVPGLGAPRTGVPGPAGRLLEFPAKLSKKAAVRRHEAPGAATVRHYGNLRLNAGACNREELRMQFPNAPRSSRRRFLKQVGVATGAALATPWLGNRVFAYNKPIEIVH